MSPLRLRFCFSAVISSASRRLASPPSAFQACFIFAAPLHAAYAAAGFRASPAAVFSPLCFLLKPRSFRATASWTTIEEIEPIRFAASYFHEVVLRFSGLFSFISFFTA